MRHPKAVFVLFAALALSWDFAPDHSWAAEEKPSAEPKPVVRTDLYGDPLPPGAIARMGSLRWRLPPGGGLTFTPDGKALAAQEDDGTIHLWDMNDGRELRPLKVDGLKLSWVFRFAPDGKVIAAKADDTVVLLDAASGRELRRMTAPDMNIACLAFSPDSTLLAVAYHEKLVRLWEVDSGKERAKLEGLELPVYSVDFSPDGRSLAVHEFEDVDVLHDKKAKCKTALRMWDLASGQTRWRLAAEGRIGEFHFLPDGKVLDCHHDKVRVLDADDGKEQRVIELGPNLPNGPWVVSKDGKTLIGWGYRRYEDAPFFRPTLALLSLAGDAKPELLEGESHTPTGAPVLSPDGKMVVTVDSTVGGGVPTVMLWDLAAKRVRHVRQGHEGGVWSVFFSPDGKTLITGSADGTIRLWDAASGKELRKFSGKRGLQPLALSPDGTALATMADDGSIRLLDVATGEELRPLEGQDNRYGTAVLRVAFSPDGKVLAGPESRKNSLVLWDISSGKRLPPVEGPTRLIDYLAFSPDGSTLAGVGYDRFDPLDGVLRLWNLKKGKLVRQLLPNPLPGQPVFGADNRLLAAVAGKGISIWDSVAGREVRHADRGFYASRCFRLVFSPDGTLFTTADNAGSNGFELRLWETATCGQVCRAYLEGHAGTVAAVAFAPDGLWVASASEDGTALVWDLREAAPDFFPEPPRSINADLLDCLWEALSGDNAATAYRAVCSLADHPQEALDFLKARLKKAPPRDSEGVRRLITDLGNDDFEMRETASRKLKDFALFAEPELRLAASSSPEVQQRAVVLLGAIDYYAMPPGRLREIRAVQTLERIGTPEARRLLEEVAEGEPLAPLTRDARAAAERLHGRQTHPDLKPE